MRKSEISRKTKETDITVYLNLDDSSAGTIDSGIGFWIIC